MAHGVPTEAETLEEFRAEYLYSGNASRCGRKLGIPERTARKIAERLEADPAFAEDGRKQRAKSLDRVQLMVMGVVEAAHDRYLEPLPMPENIPEDANITIVDKRADDGKLVVMALGELRQLAKFEAEKNGEIVPDREIVLRFEAITPKKPDGDGSSGAPAEA